VVFTSARHSGCPLFQSCFTHALLSGEILKWACSPIRKRNFQICLAKNKRNQNCGEKIEAKRSRNKMKFDLTYLDISIFCNYRALYMYMSDKKERKKYWVQTWKEFKWSRNRISWVIHIKQSRLTKFIKRWANDFCLIFNKIVKIVKIVKIIKIVKIVKLIKLFEIF
jgi:hypothetical protein